MAGLNNLISDTTTQATTLPSWMDQAQQNVVNQASFGAAAVPTLQNTVAQGAINQLGAPSNPFTSAQSTLGTIASGAANPWITNPTTGQVTPNTNTALGGLFAAQNQQLQTLIPQTVAQPDASAIGSGQFGSLRNETAADTALTTAQANLAAAQMQAAVNNQQTGVQAANAQGNVANQYGTTATGLANLQQTAPLSTAANLSKIYGALDVPTTVTKSAQLSPLSQITSLGSALGGGTNAVNSLLNTISPGTTIASLLGGLTGSSGSGMSQTASGAVTPGTFPLANGGSITVDANGNQTISNPGQPTQYFNSQGQATDSTFGASNQTVAQGPTQDGGNLSTGTDTPLYGPTPDGGNIAQVSNPVGIQDLSNQIDPGIIATPPVGGLFA